MPSPYQSNSTFTLTDVKRGNPLVRDATSLNSNNFWQTATSLNIFDDEVKIVFEYTTNFEIEQWSVYTYFY